MPIKKVWKDAEHTVGRGHPGEEGRLEGRKHYFAGTSLFVIKSVYYFYNPIFYL